MNRLRQTNQVVSQAVDSLAVDKDFLGQFALSLAQKWVQDEPIVISTPEADSLKAYFAAKAKDLLDKGVTIKQVNGKDTFFTIAPADGSYKVKLDPGTQSGTVIKLRGKGLPSVQGYGRGTGDLYVKILVWIPRKLGREEKEALERIRSSKSFTPDLNRDDKNLFDKLKNIF